MPLRGKRGPCNEVLLRWLRSHSGNGDLGTQCRRHPPIGGMSTREQLAALFEDSGLRISRQWLDVMCKRLGIPRQGKSSRPTTVAPERRREQAKVRWQRWYAAVRRDPERLEQYRARHRKPKA